MQLLVIVIIYSEMDISRTEVSRVEIKREVERVSTIHAYVRPFMHCLYFICETKLSNARKNYATVEINPNCQYVNTYTFRTLWCPPFVWHIVWSFCGT